LTDEVTPRYAGPANMSALVIFAWANIPPRSNRNDPICFSPYLYRARNQVERFFNKIKHCRRVATRYDRLAANYLAVVQLASIRLWLRANESTS
jgi:transposase